MRTRNARTFDYVDSRNLQGEALRIEQQGIRQGRIGPSSPVAPERSRGGDGQVTVAEKRTSVKGQQERGTLGGGKKDRCRRGKACGLTCIAGNEDCIIDFPMEVQAELTRMAQFILNKAKKSGDEIQAGSERDIQLGQALGMAGRHLTGKTKSGQTVFQTRKSTQSLLLTLEEIMDLKGQRNSLGQADVNEKVNEAFRKDVTSRGTKLNRKDLELIYDALPPKAKEQVNKSGDPGKGKWYGVKDGVEVTNANNGSRDRGIAVLDLYFKQGGTDAYSRSGKTFSPTEFDVEHIKPVSKGGKDHPDNWVLARSGAQRKRNNSFLGEFIDSLPNNRAEYKAYIDKEVKKSKAKKAANAVFEQMDAKSMSPQQLVSLPKNAFKYVFRGEGGTFFTNAFMPVSGGTRLSAGPPVPMAHTGALLKAYYPKETFDNFARDLKQAWNSEWGEKGGSTSSMTNSLQQIASKYLTPEHLALVKPNLDEWAAGFNAKYPEGKPK